MRFFKFFVCGKCKTPIHSKRSFFAFWHGVNLNLNFEGAKLARAHTHT